VKSTPEMRARLRELMKPEIDQCDLAVMYVLDDLENILRKLGRRAYSMSEPHLSGRRVILGFDSAEAADEAQDCEPQPDFTQAQVRRAVKAAESAGLRVRRVTVNPDGSITVDSGDARFVPVDAPKGPRSVMGRPMTGASGGKDQAAVRR
jgi:hypothetical protein